MVSLKKHSSKLIANSVDRHTFTVDGRYSFSANKVLGVGSYGVVVYALDTVTGVDMAIKRIRPYATDEHDAKRTLREIRLLMLLGSHPNVRKISYGFIRFKSFLLNALVQVVSLYALSINEAKKELYMMMELMDTNLQDLISKGKQPMNERHFKCLAKQLLEGIRAMHELNIFHRDLKPANILVSRDCQLKITDFGLARYFDPERTKLNEIQAQHLTEYVVTRWYRAPELLLAPSLPYTKAIDVWSAGCIITEMMIGRPLFPGKSYIDQVQLIFKVLGLNSVEEIGYGISESTSLFLSSKCSYPKKALNIMFPTITDEAASLLESLLAINPLHRSSAREALKHSYLTDADVLFDYEVKWVAEPPANFFAFEYVDFKVAELKALIENDVRRMTPKKISRGGSGSLSAPSSSSSCKRAPALASPERRRIKRSLHRRKSDSAIIILPDGTIVSEYLVGDTRRKGDSKEEKRSSDENIDRSNSASISEQSKSNGKKPISFGPSASTSRSSSNPFSKQFNGLHRRSRSSDSSLHSSVTGTSAASALTINFLSSEVPKRKVNKKIEMGSIDTQQQEAEEQSRSKQTKDSSRHHRRMPSDALLRVPSLVPDKASSSIDLYSQLVAEVNTSNCSNYMMSISRSSSSQVTVAVAGADGTVHAVSSVSLLSNNSSNKGGVRKVRHLLGAKERNVLSPENENETDDEDYGEVSSTSGGFPEYQYTALASMARGASAPAVLDMETLQDNIALAQAESAQSSDALFYNTGSERNVEVIAQLLSMSTKKNINFHEEERNEDLASMHRAEHTAMTGEGEMRSEEVHMSKCAPFSSCVIS